MFGTAPSLFPGLFEGQPDFIRHFLEAALHVRTLQELYEKARSGTPFSTSLLSALQIDIKVSDKDLARLPLAGPVIVVANHPFGLLDGMLLDSLLQRVRPDMRTLTNSMIAHIPELRDRCLPVDVFGHSKQNVTSLRRSLVLLRQGHGIVFFPAGEVSHWQSKRRCITDPEWNSAAVRCSKATAAPILPVYVAGNNSLGFQLAGLIHPRLRTARLPGELMNKRGRDVEVRFGSLIPSAELSRFESDEQATSYIRARTYALEHRSSADRTSSAPKVINFPLLNRTESVAPQGDSAAIAAEIQSLLKQNAPIVQGPEYAVMMANGNGYPALLQEIGRLRELTFRYAGEGSGKARDVDSFDSYYKHLILWHKRTGMVAGGYRLAWTDDVVPERGIDGLYTSTLFRFHPQFTAHLGPAVELGRSFITPDFQKDYAPLMLLWQAIGRCVARRPEAAVLFGPVSISAEYPEASRELIVQFVSRHSFRKDLAELVTPRHPFRTRLTSSDDLRMIGSCLDGVESLTAPLTDIDESCGVPVLLRQYLKLGGKVAGFNLDKKFSNALDGLLIVNLRETAPKMLVRYMGAELASAFLATACPPRSA